MTGTTAAKADQPPLVVLHGRLEAHFTELSETRRAARADASIFALEHGLTEAELRLLRSEIRAAVRRRRLDRRAWLPLVVYAAEIGYSYSGDEYWQTFEAETPGWHALDKRHYLRERFRDFGRQFSGAQPSGAWADHFTIICWPITHAVLPRDLQRQLAYLLFEYRRALTSQQLHTPEELGRSLANRAWHSSARFQNFAQDADLLGLVASSLLLGTGQENPHLLESTLARIVHDLTSERQAKAWLRGAQRFASEIRAKGIAPPRPTRAAERSGERRPQGSVADPLVFLRREQAGWTAYLQMPDFSLLTDRLPSIAEDLRTKRAIISGASGAPLTRGRLVHPGQVVRLESWPDSSTQLVALEGGSKTTNSVLADQSVMTRGPVWLFRVREHGFAREVRGKFVRPGGAYVLVTDKDPLSNAPGWIVPAAGAVGGMNTLAMTVPQSLGSNDLEALRAIGLGTVAEVEVRPAGVVPAHWDGEGRAEWLADEDPTVAISCERVVEQCIVTSDGTAQLLDWPTNVSSIFVRLRDLEPGTHEVTVDLRLTGGGTATGKIELVKRPPHLRPPAGTMREGLMILATPVTPTLTELWDDTASLELLGPVGAQVRVGLTLSDRVGKSLGTNTFTATLPMDAAQWRHFARTKMREPFGRDFDRADRLVASASHPALGSVSLSAERPSVPLRWVVRHDGDEAIVEVIDNSGAGDVQISQRSFQQPDRAKDVQIDGSELRLTKGGLVMARAGEHSSGVIVPSTAVKSLADINLRVTLAHWQRNSDSLTRLVAVSHEWWAADPPSETIARLWSQQILDLLAQTVTYLISGDHWVSLERNRAPKNWAPFFDGVGKAPSHRLLARTIVSDAIDLPGSDVDAAVNLLAKAFRLHGPKSCVRGHDTDLASFVLRLTTNPGSLPATLDAAQLRARLRLVLETPVLLKAARLLALVAQSESPTGQLEWAWP